MPYKTRAKCPARELAATPNSHPNSLARDKLINSAHPGPARLARALEFTAEIVPCSVCMRFFKAKPICVIYATPIQVKLWAPSQTCSDWLADATSAMQD